MEQTFTSGSSAVPANAPPPPHILIVDDDRDIRDLLAKFLERHRFRVTAVRDAREARRAWPNGHFQLVVLDLMLPGEPGLDFARWLRSQSEVPIVMLTAMGEETDRIIGLELGADDYVPKPFNPRELLARIRAVLRRVGEQGERKTEVNAKQLRFGGWTLDPARRRLLNPDGVEVPLTGGEYDLLVALVERANRVLTRDMLLDLLRGRQAGPFDRAIDVAISRLRRKLEDDGRNAQLIKTVRGGGYVLAASVEQIEAAARNNAEDHSGARTPGSEMKLHLWPRSLATRTAVVLLAGLALVQIAGLTIHALDRIELQRIAITREAARRAIDIYRGLALAAPADREDVVHEMDLRDGATVRLLSGPEPTDLPMTPPPIQREMRVNMQLVPMPGSQRPHEIFMAGGLPFGRVSISMRLPEGHWVDVTLPMASPRPWHSPTFLIAFLLMTATAAVLIIWAVRRLTAPVRTLALAAEALGRDVNAPPLPEDGPTEVATAAAAFNLMAARIRRFVQDRTFLLTAIGHDLKTPITRLKLRAEFLEDDELRRKILADLDELQAMVSATLTFGRDATTDEPVSAIDLPELARTILDETADANPDAAERLVYEGPDHVTVRARPVSLKRALTNLVTNAVAYGGSARVTLSPPRREAMGRGTLTLLVEDEGPGIPANELERVFQPFTRLEASRNRETGGTGLGLPIARNILRAHGGDVTLANRATGGARAIVTLPV